MDMFGSDSMGESGSVCVPGCVDDGMYLNKVGYLFLWCRAMQDSAYVGVREEAALSLFWLAKAALNGCAKHREPVLEVYGQVCEWEKEEREG